MADIPAAQQAVAGQDDHQQPHEALHQAEHDDAAAAQQGVAPGEAAAVVGAAAAEQQQAQPPAAGEDHHQQEQQHGQLMLQPLHQQQQQAQHQAGIAAAPAGVPPAAAAGPPVEAPSRPHFSYAPEEECDLVLCTSDGKRIGVHRLIVLRTCSLFKELLAACTGETEVAVAERYDEVKPLLLDIFYDRSVAIRPEMALQVFHLADKYEAPSLMQACRAVFLSDAFELGILGANTFASGTTGGQLDSLKGHASWIEMMSLASKHKYGDLVKRCVAFFLKQCQERPSLALESLVGDRALLPALAQPHLEEMLLGLAGSALALDSRTQQDLAATRKQLQESQAELEALKRKLEVKHSSYMKLLGKHNRLLDKCEKHQVTWHKDLEPPQKKAKK